MVEFQCPYHRSYFDHLMILYKVETKRNKPYGTATNRMFQIKRPVTRALLNAYKLEHAQHARAYFRDPKPLGNDSITPLRPLKVYSWAQYDKA